MKKAFTLIELLVVIAIIAILAAILFPVFAQAKEAAKKTATLSNFKQMGTATAVYSADSDDLFPLAWSYNTAGATWRWNFLTSVPNGWRNNGVQNIEPRRSEDGLFWANSLQPYVKNNQLMEQNGIPATTVVADPVVPGMIQSLVGIAMNGLLHKYSGTAIEQPSKIPLYWAGAGKQNRRGFGLTNPAINCTTQGEGCMFNPGGGGGGAWFGMESIMVYGTGMHFSAADTSAKFRNLRTSTDGANLSRDYYNNPFAQMNTNGTPVSMWFCSITGATASYPCVFRPDQTL